MSDIPLFGISNPSIPQASRAKASQTSGTTVTELTVSSWKSEQRAVMQVCQVAGTSASEAKGKEDGPYAVRLDEARQRVLVVGFPPGQSRLPEQSSTNS